jgi:Flp pilus assembly protein TadD
VPGREGYLPGAVFPRIDRRLRAALLLSLAVALFHLVPLFLPRQRPEVDLRLATVLSDPTARSRHLEPLLDNPQSEAGHLHQAARLVLPADPGLARKFLAEADRRGGTEAERRLLEARICHAEGNRACATEALNHARALLPDDPRPELLEADLADGDDSEAGLAALGRAHARAPGDVEVALRYARALGRAGSLDLGLRVLSTVEPRMAPEQALLERGLLKLGGGDNQGAAAELEAAAQAAPELGRVRYFLGVALYRLNDSPRAEVALREASRLDPLDWRPLALLCALQREDKRWDDAAVSRAMLDARFRAFRSEYEGACPP